MMFGMTKEWWTKNVSGVIAASLAGIMLYALGAYISSSISKEMKNYVPVTVWSQWAQERGEWRGSVDQQLKGMGTEQQKQRDEILKELRDNAKTLAVQTSVMQDVKDETKELKEQLKAHVLSDPRKP